MYRQGTISARNISRMAIEKTKVEKLRDAENWQQWGFVIRTLLESDDLREVCEGAQIKPEQGTVNFNIKMAAWNKANKAAKKLIVMTVESKPGQLIMSCGTAKDMWTKLQCVWFEI